MLVTRREIMALTAAGATGAALPLPMRVFARANTAPAQALSTEFRHVRRELPMHASHWLRMVDLKRVNHDLRDDNRNPALVDEYRAVCRECDRLQSNAWRDLAGCLTRGLCLSPNGAADRAFQRAITHTRGGMHSTMPIADILGLTEFQADRVTARYAALHYNIALQAKVPDCWRWTQPKDFYPA